MVYIMIYCQLSTAMQEVGNAVTHSVEEVVSTKRNRANISFNCVININIDYGM